MVNGRLRLAIVLACLSAAFLSAQQKTAVINGKEISYSAVSRNGEEYVSAPAMAAKAGVRFFENPQMGKIEFRGPEMNVKLTAGSPFAVISRLNPDTLFTLQMSAAVHFAQGAYFLPWKNFALLLTEYLGCRVEGVTRKAKKEIPRLNDTANAESAKLDSIIKIVEKPSLKNSYEIAVDEKANGTLVRITSRFPVGSRRESLAGNILTIAISPAYGAAPKLPALKKKSVVSKMTAAQKDSTALFIFELTGDYANHEMSELSPTVTQVILQNKKFTPAANPKKDKWKFDAIIIDAGHGGKDYGAIGADNTVEKEINLSVALKFGRLVKANLPDVKVVFTRDDDTFVELYRRGQIANEHGGKLFVSIHCNSVPGRSGSASGYEIYLLRPGRTAEAISIAARENAVINYEENPDRYQKLTDENLILVSMAHASYMKYSEKFAEILDQQLSGSVSLKSRGVKQAGFLVLVGASMPSILFETGYLSNPRDAAYLRSPEGQESLAQALFRAVESFKAYYTSELEGQ